ncbi:alpha/beta hydrolase [Roseateles sp. BYS78W]|uniref:Alpha/beta hydrolase n=1 Tax=Pelomonas candidula TaxID=3299025 RepID=A0ABW7HCA1_9BURK
MAMLIASIGLIVDRVAIRDAGLHPPAVGQVAFSVAVADGVDVPVYLAGNVDGGCVILFPGQHGLAGGFEGQLAPLMASRGIATFTATYAARPDGPRLTLEQARRFALEVVRQVEQRCGRRYLVIGRSLGSMLAAYATRGHRPAALLLEGASPSLAAALRSAMTPLLGRRLASWMPLERLLTTNYNLQDALGAEPRFPVTIIQGARDVRTPASDLTEPGAVPAWVEIVPVPDADHQGTWRAFMPEYIERIAGAL